MERVTLAGRLLDVLPSTLSGTEEFIDATLISLFHRYSGGCIGKLGFCERHTTVQNRTFLALNRRIRQRQSRCPPLGVLQYRTARDYGSQPSEQQYAKQFPTVDLPHILDFQLLGRAYS
jgi:hypothetical protein